MSRVQVVISSYNGEKHIIRQIESIMAQTGVEVSVLVRDDGSSDQTVQVLKNYGTIHKNLSVIAGQNIGWRKSFLEALRNCEKFGLLRFF